MRILLLILFLFPSVVFGQTVQSPGTIKDEYSKKSGNLLLSATSIAFGNIYSNEKVVDTVFIYNSSGTSISLNPPLQLPSYISLRFNKRNIEPHGKSHIIITYDASVKNDFGFFVDRFPVLTNDPLHTEKYLQVSATVKEYFDPADTVLVPKSRYNELKYDFGNISKGEKRSHQFPVFNDGNKPLIIHSAKSTCGCIKTTVSKPVILPGESGVIKVDYDSSGKSGTDKRTVTVYQNDRNQPEITIELSANVL